MFAAVNGNGAVVQIHVQDGVDGLAGPGTIASDPGSEADPGVVGIAFKWNPERVLYVADIARDRLVLLHLDDDRRHFTVARTSVMASPALNQPVDLAAAVPEIANPRFASHTTLAGGSDLYVANRGDGSLVRLHRTARCWPVPRSRYRHLARWKRIAFALSRCPPTRSACGSHCKASFPASRATPAP